MMMMGEGVCVSETSARRREGERETTRGTDDRREEHAITALIDVRQSGSQAGGGGSVGALS